MFGGGHGHSHEADDHGHSHTGKHGHSHTGGGKSNIGFGDDDEEFKKGPMNKAMIMNQNMMMMKMMAAAATSQGNAGAADPTMAKNSPMAMMPQMTPQMVEFAKKMFEERQKMMKQYIEQGGQSNPAALQEMMAKAAQQQSQALALLKEANNRGEPTGDGESDVQTRVSKFN